MCQSLSKLQSRLSSWDNPNKVHMLPFQAPPFSWSRLINSEMGDQSLKQCYLLRGRKISSSVKMKIWESAALLLVVCICTILSCLSAGHLTSYLSSSLFLAINFQKGARNLAFSLPCPLGSLQMGQTDFEPWRCCTASPSWVWVCPGACQTASSS